MAPDFLRLSSQNENVVDENSRPITSELLAAVEAENVPTQDNVSVAVLRLSDPAVEAEARSSSISWAVGEGRRIVLEPVRQFFSQLPGKAL